MSSKINLSKGITILKHQYALNVIYEVHQRASNAASKWVIRNGLCTNITQYFELCVWWHSTVISSYEEVYADMEHWAKWPKSNYYIARSTYFICLKWALLHRLGDWTSRIFHTHFCSVPLVVPLNKQNWNQSKCTDIFPCLPVVQCLFPFLIYNISNLTDN